MTRKQLEGLKYCPDKRVREAVDSALSYCQRAADAEQQVRELQERIALKEQDYRILAIVHRDGTVELYAEQWMPVKFAYWPELGKSREDEAEEWALARLPPPYRTLYDSPERKRIGMATAKSCLTRGELSDVKAKLASIEAVKELERTRGGEA